MGNASTMILVILSINLFMGMIALGIASIDPASDLLLANKLFGTDPSDTGDNVVVRGVSEDNGVYSYDWNGSQFDSLGSEDSSILSTTGSIVPDWIRSGWSWAMGAGRTFINFVGAGFTIVSSLGLDGELAALIGTFWGIFTTFIMINWLLGRET